MSFKDTVRAIRKKRKKKKESYGDQSLNVAQGDTPGGGEGGNPGGN